MPQFFTSPKYDFDNLWSSEVGVTKPISPVPLFSPFFCYTKKYWLPIEHHVHIWQMWPQLSCSDICQIWMGFKESNIFFCMIEIFPNGEINKRSFSNPHPRSMSSARDNFNCLCHFSIKKILEMQIYFSSIPGRCSQTRVKIISVNPDTIGNPWWCTEISGQYCWHIEAKSNWAPFSRQHLQMHFLEWKCTNLD